MRIILTLLLFLTSCIEYRLSRPGMPDKYLGWSNTNHVLDPKIGPKAKIYLTNSGSIRPYIGVEIIRQEELLLGIGMIYYVDRQESFEIGIRDSVYKNDKLLDDYRNDNGSRIDPFDDMNPMLYVGGVLKF